MRRLLAAGLLSIGLAGPLASQEADVAIPPDAPAADVVGPDYAQWEEAARRAEDLSESGTASAFALTRLREELVAWREVFADAQSDNADRIATVQAQIAALTPQVAEGEEPVEDPRIVARREELRAELARLRAPGLLAQEAFVRADGLVGEIDGLTRSQQAAALLSRSPTPLNPGIWPEMGDAVAKRALGLWKEVTVSIRSEPRLAVFAETWPGAALLLALGGVLVARARRWIGRLEGRWSAGRSRRRFRGPHAANVGRLAASILATLAPLVGIVLIVAGLEATGLLGARARALLESLPLAAACILATTWLAERFFSPERDNPPPFDFPAGVKSASSRRLAQAGWILGVSLVARAFLSVGEIEPEVRAGVMLPIYILLAFVVFRFGGCLVFAEGQKSEDEEDSVAFRRRVVVVAGQAIMSVAVASPILMLLGFHRAGSALLMPSVVTLGLMGLLIVLQWLAADLYALVSRREEGLREALVPVLIGFALLILALPVVALIWGARPEDLSEAWTRFLGGISFGETRLSPRQFAMFAIVFAAGWALTRVIQGTLRSTLLPRTRLDAGARNAVVSGLGYLGLTVAALIAVSVAGLDLSNLAIVAGALSVGIGFGLQNIVQNFVSGIILLIERPISEGDWIEVGPRMGYVRDISVRSTRIETFDRTDVIVPNADLVSGQVVNWTRGNLVGRIILPVTVGYGNDVDQVVQILKGIAEAHPMVLLSPPPAVVLAGFGADIMNFEIRAIIRDVNFGTTVRSEMNQEIAKRFHAEGIRTAAPPAPAPPPPKPVATPG